MTVSILEMPKFLAVTGREASGKDSYVAHLVERGYLHIAAGDVMRERARQAGYEGELTRDILSKVGDEFKAEFGSSPITTSSVEAYEQQVEMYPAGLVISGLRRVGEIKAFKERGAVVLWVDANPERRFARQQERARGDSNMTIEEFERMSNKEYYGAGDGNAEGVNLQAVEALADIRVGNNGSLEEFLAAADDALHQSV